VIIEGVGVMLLMAMANAPEGDVGRRAPVAPPGRVQSDRFVVRKQVIIRSVRVLPGAPAGTTTIIWREGKGPRCLPVRSIAGAALRGQNSVDFILRDRTRVRARLQNACPALDYYSGFYLTPGADGLICADRDFLRSRVGRECGIDRFRVLRARKPR
jgi:hypothetical protein